MGLKASGRQVNLNELKGDLLALRYEQEIEITHTPSWSEEEITQSVPRAEVVRFNVNGDELKAERLGSSLVYHKAIQTEIRGSSDWAFGELEQVERPTAAAADATMYQLVAPDGLAEETVAAAMEAAGITV